MVFANVAAGWRQLRDNFGFYGFAHQAYEGDDLVTVRVWVSERLAQPHRAGDSFPLDLQSTGSSPSKALSFRLSDGCLAIGIYMSTVANSRRSGEKPGFYEDGILIARNGSVAYSLRFYAAVNEEQPGPPEWIEHDLVGNDEALRGRAQLHEAPPSDIEERLTRVSLAVDALEGRVGALVEDFQRRTEGSLQAVQGNGAKQTEELEKIAQELGVRWSQQFQSQAETVLESLREEVKNSRFVVEESKRELASVTEAKLGQVGALVEDFQGRVEGSLQAVQGNGAKQAKDLEKIVQELGGQWSQQFQKQAGAVLESLREEVKNSQRVVEESKRELASVTEAKLGQVGALVEDFQGRVEGSLQAVQGNGAKQAKDLEKIVQELGGQWSQQFQKQAGAVLESLREEVKNSQRVVEESKRELASVTEAKLGQVGTLIEDFQGRMEGSLQAVQGSGAKQAKDLEKIAQELGGQWSQQFQKQAEAVLESLQEEVKNSRLVVEESRRELANVAEAKLGQVGTLIEDFQGRIDGSLQAVQVNGAKQTDELEKIVQELGGQWSQQIQKQAEAVLESLREEVKNSRLVVEESKRELANVAEAKLGRVGTLIEDFQGRMEGSLQAVQGSGAKQAKDLEKIAQELGGQWSQQFQKQAEAVLESLREEVKNSQRVVEESKRELASVAEAKLGQVGTLIEDFQGRTEGSLQAVQGSGAKQAKDLEKIAQELGGQWSQQFQKQAEAVLESLREEVKNSQRVVEESKRELASVTEAKLGQVGALVEDFQGRTEGSLQAVQGNGAKQTDELEKIVQELGGQWSQQFQKQAEAVLESLREEVKSSRLVVEESKRELASVTEAKLGQVGTLIEDFQGRTEGSLQAVQGSGAKQAKDLEKIAQELGGQWSQQFQKQAEAVLESLREEVKNSQRVVEESKRELASVTEAKLGQVGGPGRGLPGTGGGQSAGCPGKRREAGEGFGENCPGVGGAVVAAVSEASRGSAGEPAGRSEEFATRGGGEQAGTGQRD